jgi:hypothetical protein
MVFAGNLQNSREGILKLVHSVPYLFRNLSSVSLVLNMNPPAALYMLVDQDDGNILALFRKPVERLFHLWSFRLRIADQEVLLGIRGIGDMTDASKEETCDRAGGESADGTCSLDRRVLTLRPQ